MELTDRDHIVNIYEGFLYLEKLEVRRITGNRLSTIGFIVQVYVEKSDTSTILLLEDCGWYASSNYKEWTYPMANRTPYWLSVLSDYRTINSNQGWYRLFKKLYNEEVSPTKNCLLEYIKVALPEEKELASIIYGADASSNELAHIIKEIYKMGVSAGIDQSIKLLKTEASKGRT